MLPSAGPDFTSVSGNTTLQAQRRPMPAPTISLEDIQRILITWTCIFFVFTFLYYRPSFRRPAKKEGRLKTDVVEVSRSETLHNSVLTES